MVLVVVVDVSVAVAPETDRVEVAQGAVTLQLGEDIRDLGCADAGDAMFAQNVFDLCCCFRSGAADILEVDL